MQDNARRFARRTLATHLLLLAAVLAAVAVAARQIYHDAYTEVVVQAQARQRLLATQTARGIENHYGSILNDMDLLRRADGDEMTKPPTTRPATTAAADRSIDTPNQRALQRTLTASGRSGAGGLVVGGVMWRQLAGRVSLLFACERSDPATRPPVTAAASGQRSAADEPYAGSGPRFRERPPTAVRLADGPPPDDRLDEPAPAEGRDGPLFGRGPAGRGRDGRPGDRVRLPPKSVRLIGTDVPELDPAEVLRVAGDWVRSQATPSVSTFQRFGTGEDQATSGNLVCVPLQRGRDLVALVPIGRVQSDFLGPLNGDPATAAWLVDQRSAAMAASRPDLIGADMGAVGNRTFQDLFRRAMAGHMAGTAVVQAGFDVGPVAFAPAMVAAEPVTVANRRWELFVSTSLEDVDGTVNRLFRRAVWWCAFVVISVAGILTSTAARMIRGRTRVERLRHEVLTREMGQARQIQLAWLPDGRPGVGLATAGGGVDVAAVNSPASHISGDFYNWFDLPDGRLAVAIGDVTGHGMAAAFLMATTQLLTRTTLTRLADPGRCLAEVNRQLCVQAFNGQFVTMLVAVLDPVAGHVLVATAGHPAPLVICGQTVCPLPVEPQLVLGVDCDATYPTETHALPAGAGLLLYTDGVVECPAADGSRFGTDRLRLTLAGLSASAADTVDRIVAAVDAFRGTRLLDDDLTLVAIRPSPTAS